MIKKCIAVFFVFFLGMSALITVDNACRESTGCGGDAGLSITQTEDGDLNVSFFGIERKLDMK